MDDVQVAVLEVRGISKAFGGVAALDSVDFAVRRGEVCSIIGPNGAGKSTLFDIVAGVQTPDAGRISFQGQDITTMAPHRRARLGLARTYQELRLFGSMTTFENLMVAPFCTGRAGVLDILFCTPRERRERVAAHAVAEALLDRLKLRHRRDLPVGVLSHGQKRLVEIGRAIAGRPKLLILDEPTAGLNAENKQLFVEVVLPSLRDGVEAVVLIEHDMDVVMTVSDRVIVLAHGRKIAEGRPAAVQDDPVVMREYFGT